MTSVALALLLGIAPPRQEKPAAPPAKPSQEKPSTPAPSPAPPAAAPNSATATGETLVEVEEVKELKPSNELGTTSYQPRDKEKPFFEKTSAEERAPGSFFSEYSILGKSSKYVAWLGVVRKVTPKGEEKDAPRTLLVEDKYFDGKTDTHILALSFNGGGDFEVEVGRSAAAIEPLALVRVYGTVVDEKDGQPKVRAEYVRVFPWRTFTFLDCYGKDHSNPEWRKLCKVDRTRIYTPWPDDRYYEARLGPKPKASSSAETKEGKK